ncbi:Transcription initiation factor TFIID subunit 5 [Tulasnella sp. 418]|nr:Transcription initiation factor TFIID subunit 5 [Tulasnella sp. 418]
MSTPSSSKPSPEAASTPAFNANLPFPTNEVEPNSEASANEQNAFVLQWLLARGHKTVAKQLEEEMKSGKAGSDPIVIPGDPGSDEEGDANNKDAEGKPALAKRRASARLAKQTQKETISAQELVTKNAPKGAAAVQAAVSAANAAATSTTAAASTAAAAKKGVARGKSPTSAMKSPTTSTHPPLKPSGSGSKVGTSTTITADHGLKSPTPASSTPTVPTPDATQLFNLLSSIITASSSMAANATTTTTPQQAQSLTANLIATLNKAGMTIDEAMARDPVDKQQGYKDLEAWVEGALDMYRPEFRPILFPVFVHFYLELVLEGFKEAAVTFYKTYAPSLSISHTNILQHLQTITLPHHVNEDELAQRFRSEKYVIRMSRSGFGLMLGWLMEGSGGEAMGAGEGFGGDSNKRGRAAVRRILNDRIDVDVTSASTTEVHPSAWEENTGLLSSIVPSADGASTSKFVPSPAAFNQARGQLKLGPMPLDQGLLDETQRTLREEAESEASLTDGMNGVEPTGKRRLTVNTGHDPTLVAPSASDLLPRPPSFKAIDVKREVEKVRDARKRIRLEPSTLSGSDVELGLDRAALFAKSGALPSICAYTFHDAADG